MKKYLNALVTVLLVMGSIELMYYMIGVSTPSLLVKGLSVVFFTLLLVKNDPTLK